MSGTKYPTRHITALLLAVLVLPLLFLGCSKSKNEEQFAAVEADRAQQQKEAQAQASQAPSPSPSLQPGAAASASPGAPSTAAAHASRNYWTQYRGPNRDGRYDEMQVLTNWPSTGLQLLWKEPIGVGYASVTVADGRAYTLEQRRSEEVVAAYDVNTGRELWTAKWKAAFTDETGDGPRTTPTYDDGWLYVLGATGELRSVNASNGSVRWGKTF